MAAKRVFSIRLRPEAVEQIERRIAENRMPRNHANTPSYARGRYARSKPNVSAFIRAAIASELGVNVSEV